MPLKFAPPKTANHYPDRAIDCQMSIDEAFLEIWENVAAAGWRPEEIAGALYELTDNHLTALRENEFTELRLARVTSRRD